MAKPPKKRKKARKRKKLSLEEKRQRRAKRTQRRDVQAVFSAGGFSRIAAIADKEFEYEGVRSDFDDAFVLQNVLVLVEYTISNDPGAHLKSKKAFFDKVLEDTSAFHTFVRTAFPSAVPNESRRYDSDQFEVRILYCSLNDLSSAHKTTFSQLLFMESHVLQYFKHLTDVIANSSLPELLNYLRIDFSAFGPNILSPAGTPSAPYSGSLLPESHSRFPPGYKVVSFYVDPEALLQRAYVLRRDGWRDRGALYQRMVGKKKVEAVRAYLLREERVFINNIIVTLPSDTKLEDENGDTIQPRKLKKTEVVKVRIPGRYNSVGIIDGQHRIYSYYEGGPGEKRVSDLRVQQNLLATGIIYPQSATEDERIRFEATLFLEINANQTNAKSDLKQSIGLLIKPFEPESIAREVINVLNAQPNGPLGGKFEKHFFDKTGMKTTSVVSYGLRPLIRPDGESNNLFAKWSHPKKKTMISKERDALRRAYVEFAAGAISEFISAAKDNLPATVWTHSKEVSNYLLTPTTINVLLVCMRHVLEAKKAISFQSASAKFANLTPADLRAAHSSQYTVHGRRLFEKYFQN